METAPHLAPPLHKVHARVGPYSRSGAIALIDGRSREALFMKARRAELTAHVGGTPNAVQRHLIERAVRLMLGLELLDERLTHGQAFTAHDHNYYIAWSNALTRTLARLGLQPAAAAPPSLEDYLAARAEILADTAPSDEAA